MQVDIRHDPAFAVARCNIAPGETIHVESGAMYAQTLGMEISSEAQGGLLNSLKRSLLSGDSFFVSKFRAPNGGWVDIVPTYPGDVFSMDIDPANPLVLTRGAWLASSSGVNLDTKFGGARMAIGGEGFFTVKCTGSGTVVASAYGAMDIHSLKDGEALTVDTGHIVAYSNDIRHELRKAGTGLLSSFKSGEGIVMDFYGPGDVITQSRNPSGFASFIASLLPNKG